MNPNHASSQYLEFSRHYPPAPPPLHIYSHIFVISLAKYSKFIQNHPPPFPLLFRHTHTNTHAPKYRLIAILTSLLQFPTYFLALNSLHFASNTLPPTPTFSPSLMTCHPFPTSWLTSTLPMSFSACNLPYLQIHSPRRSYGGFKYPKLIMNLPFPHTHSVRTFSSIVFACIEI